MTLKFLTPSSERKSFFFKNCKLGMASYNQSKQGGQSVVLVILQFQVHYKGNFSYKAVKENYLKSKNKSSKAFFSRHLLFSRLCRTIQNQLFVATFALSQNCNNNECNKPFSIATAAAVQAAACLAHFTVNLTDFEPKLIWFDFPFLLYQQMSDCKEEKRLRSWKSSIKRRLMLNLTQSQGIFYPYNLQQQSSYQQY